MKLNPIKAYRQWRTRRQERKDAKLRLMCLKCAMEARDGFVTETMDRAFVYYVYLKHGVSKDGVEVHDIFRIMRDELNPPKKPIKL
ncbi:MAG: hypothetical protein NC418_02455 [Muribaculaceae bacterium]|nr:hypothetical protein [Muribaculaceae bacterium]